MADTETPTQASGAQDTQVTQAPSSVAGVGQVPTTFAASVAPAATPAADMKLSFMDSVPAEYKDKLWVKDLAQSEAPFAKLFEQHENAQAMIGKKSTGVEIPGEGASEESVKAFRKAIGVPESVDGYKYDPVDISKEPEAVQKYVEKLGDNKAFVDAMRAQAHKDGLTEAQFKSMSSTYDQLRLEEVRQSVQTMVQMQDEYVANQRKQFNEIFGKDSDHVQKIAKETAAKVLPENVRASNDPDIALFYAMKFINEHVYKNDTVSVSGAPAGSAMNKEQIQALIMEKRANPAFRDWRSPEHEAVKAEINALYDRMHSV